MKKFSIMGGIILLLALFVSCNSDELNSLIHNSEESSDKIAAIDQQVVKINESLAQLQKADKDLGELIASLKEEDSSIRKSLESTKKALEDKIAELKAYVDEELKKSKNWVSATFATLEQYQSLCDEVASLRSLLESLDISSIDEALDGLENSMKTWVNTQLANYYTIAEMNAKLEALQNAITNGDSANAEEIATLRQNLETAKSELTSAYQAAIEAAINQNNGVINQKIADDIKTATDAMQGKLDGLSARIDAFENRLTALEASVAKLINMVQSVVVVPDYYDGSVKLSKVIDNKVRFEVYPLEAAAGIAETGPSILSMDYVVTFTKSSEDFVNLPITAVAFTGKTLLIMVDGTGIPDSILTGASSANARLKISDGTNTRTSEYFPIYKQGGGSNPQTGVAITGESANVGESSAKLFGWCNQEWAEGTSVVFGIEYSATDLTTAATAITATEKDAENRYYCQATGLSSNTLYYYRAFTLFNGVWSYGEVKTFKTRDFNATVTTHDATDITVFKSSIHGSLSVSSTDGLDKSVWFLYSSTASTVDALRYGGERINASLSNGSFSYNLTSLAYNTTYYYVAAAKVHDKEFYGEVKTFKTLNLPVPQAVDMGTVVGGKNIKWASFNIGASSPEEYGLYYAWGETEPKNYFNWENYKWGSSLAKYNTVDKKTELDSEDDVAHVTFGGKWRMPTNAEWDALLTQCTWTWTNDYNGTGVSGAVATATNGNSIFLPFAGYRSLDHLYEESNKGYFWCNSCITDTKAAWGVVFMAYLPQSGICSLNRFRGHPVRPVTE